MTKRTENKNMSNAVIGYTMSLLERCGFLEVLDKLYIEQTKKKFEDVMRAIYGDLFLRRKISHSFDEVDLLIHKFQWMFEEPDKNRKKLINFHKEFENLFFSWNNVVA